jgi:protocatechuate 3,4-dioxygenase, alpha subunit
VNLPRTPSQTVGPFFAFGLAMKPLLVAADATDAVRIEGRMLDGAGEPVPDGIVEIWSADAGGRYEGNAGWGRCATGPDGGYGFTARKPGPARAPDGDIQAPVVHVLCFARGLLKPVLTRIYFPDEAEANAADPVLRAISDDGERATLIAAPAGRANYRFDIRLQGDAQTVFFTTPAFGL